MKSILLVFFLCLSISSYGQYAKKDLSENYVSDANDLFFEKMVVHLNPSCRLLNISNALLDKITFYDMLGQLQKTVVVLTNKEDHLIDLSQLLKGTYFIVLEKDDKTTRRKIIIN
ncbi:T9SS type A sorting domain-containing protein [Flavobacterium flavigenum]|uniref:T9SS type A sorting domain-containing protein n=1 Tax=Flavobacterium flavigenum TaxID=3003258 RepID=UPI002482D9E7|nr:T9SS type A sorting domain-containing protein [Flavobacterium flavigenum]